MRNRFYLILLSALVLVGSAPTMAQSPAAQANRGLTFSEGLWGSSNSEGKVLSLNSSVGYDFNRFFGVDLGIPVYFVRATLPTGTRVSSNGIGDFYGDVRLSFENPIVNYYTSLTGTAPTGDTAKGRSTGRATFDWNNRFDRSFGRLTPFFDAGIANTVNDTRYFVRPFRTLGGVAHFEAGGEYKLFHGLSLGASAYDIAPWGTQHVFSRFVERAPGTPPSTVIPRHRRAFETAAETIGSADLTRDNGFSTWLALRPASWLGLQVGYTRSIPLHLDTITFGVVVAYRPSAGQRRGP